MSLLPQYRRLPTDDIATSPGESKTEADDGHNNGDDYDRPHTEPPSYPPRQYPATGPNAAGTTTLIFVPKYPMKGSLETVLGVMGRDREETVSIVQRAFPTLSEYPTDRIDFLAPLHDKASLEGDTGWSRILPEAWERIYAHPPPDSKLL